MPEHGIRGVNQKVQRIFQWIYYFVRHLQFHRRIISTIVRWFIYGNRFESFFYWWAKNLLLLQGQALSGCQQLAMRLKLYFFLLPDLFIIWSLLSFYYGKVCNLRFIMPAQRDFSKRVIQFIINIWVNIYPVTAIRLNVRYLTYIDNGISWIPERYRI